MRKPWLEINATAISPEPSTIVMTAFGAGIVLLGMGRRFRKAG